jgi:hypothetical protein
MKSQASEVLHPKSLQSKISFARKIESPIKPLQLLHGRLAKINTVSYALWPRGDEDLILITKASNAPPAAPNLSKLVIDSNFCRLKHWDIEAPIERTRSTVALNQAWTRHRVRDVCS